MAKIILLVLGLLLVYWIVRSYRRRVDRNQPAVSEAARAEDMVQCAHCGVHLPRSESFTTQGRFYCCPEHSRIHSEKSGSSS